MESGSSVSTQWLTRITRRKTDWQAGRFPASSVVMATVPKLKLKEGDKAPIFKAATNGGGTAALKDFKGRDLVLFFYPKDDTPG